MGDLRYVNLTEDLAPACHRLELSAFPAADPAGLLSEEDIRVFAGVFPDGFFVALDGDEPVVHTNHCVAEVTQAVQGPRAPARIASTENRYARAVELLGKRPIDEQSLMALTRDEEAICERPEPPYDVMSCGATVMRPATGDLWAVSGLPAEHEYEHFTVGRG